MSFIYDDQDLINTLINIALKKNAQGLPAPQTAQETQANESLLKLINGLQSHIKPSAHGVIYHEGDVTNRPSLNSTNLESLGDLLRFLSSSKIIMDGKRIAYNSDEEKQVGQGYKFYSLETHTYSEPMRGDAQKGFYINPELLKSYVEYLQSYNAKSPQPGMDILLKSLIGEINSSMNLGMSDKYEQQAAPQLADNTLLDNVPQDFNGTTADLYQGPVPLNYGDVKSLNAFRTWLQTNQITTAKNGQKSTIQDQVNFNECMVLGSLAQRAAYMTRLPIQDQQQADKIKVYQEQIAAIGKQAQCPVFGGSGQQQGQSGKPNTAALLAEIVADRPLARTDVDLNRIDRFFTKITSLMGNVPVIPQMKNSFDQAVAKLNTLMDANIKTFTFGMPRASFENYLKNKDPRANDFNAVVGTLRQIVDFTMQALAALRSAYGNQDANVTKMVGEQIGFGGQPEGSILGGNLREFDNWFKQTR